MPIRHARYSDIPIMARVLAASFGPDKLFQIMFPHQDQYPEDLITAFRRNLREAWWDYSKVLMVSYDDAPDEDKLNDHQSLTTTGAGQREIVTGLAEWQRVGRGWEHVWNVLRWWDPQCLVQKWVSLRHVLSYMLRPCRASAKPTDEDPYPLLITNFVARLMPFSTPLLCNPLKPWRANHWSLEVLGIHPAFQGRGNGKRLAQWGLSEAQLDTASDVTGIPCVAISADTKETFYQKVGFREIVGWTSRSIKDVPEVNPLEERGCGGGAVLWSWVREDEDAAKAKATKENA